MDDGPIDVISCLYGCTIDQWYNHRSMVVLYVSVRCGHTQARTNGCMLHSYEASY